MNDCVFCGQPIHADQPVAGRPPMAAHATCADAALADDRHWDAVAAASPVSEVDDETTPGTRGRSSSRTGCLTLVAVALCLAAGIRSAPGRRP